MGALDAGFGVGGVATVRAGAGRNAVGYGVGVTATGRLLTLGSGGAQAELVTALTPTGVADPAYNGGAPVAVRLSSVELLVNATGSVESLATSAWCA